MGLDMYLSKKTYVKNWDYMGSDQRTTITLSGFRAAAVKASRISEITEEIGYWRKFNALHAWFVNECQDGRDECQEVHVSQDALCQLRDDLTKVLLDRSRVDELLPPTEGFFFGSTTIDERYFDEVRRTLDLILPLCDDDTGDYYYRASW